MLYFRQRIRLHCPLPKWERRTMPNYQEAHDQRPNQNTEDIQSHDLLSGISTKKSDKGN